MEARARNHRARMQWARRSMAAIFGLAVLTATEASFAQGYAGSISYSNGVLTITGTGSEDYISVEGTSSGVYISADFSGYYQDFFGIYEDAGDCEGVTSIVIYGMEGDDTISLWYLEANGDFTNLENDFIEMHGGDGDDTLYRPQYPFRDPRIKSSFLYIDP